MVLRNFFGTRTAFLMLAMALAVAAFVVTFAFSVAAFVVTFAFSVAALVLTFAFAVAMAFSFLRLVFPMEAVFEFIWSSIPHGNDLPFEIQDLACHWMIKVHGDGIFLYGCDCPPDHLVGAVEHRNHGAYLEQVLTDDSVNHEGILRNVKAALRIPLPVALFRLEGEFEALSRLLALDLLFETRDQHMSSVDVVQWPFFCRLVDDFPVYRELVCQSDDFVACYFHILSDVGKLTL
jgi:hypothetical protein